MYLSKRSICDSVMACDEIIEVAKITSTNFNKKKITCKIENLHILLTYLLIYRITIDGCKYLLLLQKALTKTKTFITISRHHYQIKRS